MLSNFAEFCILTQVLSLAFAFETKYLVLSPNNQGACHLDVHTFEPQFFNATGSVEIPPSTPESLRNQTTDASRTWTWHTGLQMRYGPTQYFWVDTGSENLISHNRTDTVCAIVIASFANIAPEDASKDRADCRTILSDNCIRSLYSLATSDRGTNQCGEFDLGDDFGEYCKEHGDERPSVLEARLTPTPSNQTSQELCGSTSDNANASNSFFGTVSYPRQIFWEKLSEEELYNWMVPRTYVMLVNYFGEQESSTAEKTDLLCLKNTEFAEGSRLPPPESGGLRLDTVGLSVLSSLFLAIVPLLW